jgi:spore coat polysaccharide biosynthesis protein SpsF (cytidylyltransferase family)/sialic acid synthase SpsE
MTGKYIILEVASTHSGQLSYIEQLLKEFKKIENVGIKFQPFKYDLLAETDYKGYNTYKELYFDEATWKQIIIKATETKKEVWLDLFDEYSVEILEQNLDLIKGFKIQASVLGNFRLFEKLRKVNTENKKCILNISAYELSEIEEIIERIKKSISSEMILQMGFQSHPTEFLNSGLSKLDVIKKAFPEYNISFADHLENNSPDVLTLPFLAQTLGANVIEKHVKCELLATKYDHYSSIDFKQFDEFLALSNKYSGLLSQPFINNEEREYLRKSLLVPILNKDKKAGQILSKDDFSYKRTNKQGIDALSLVSKTKDLYVISTDLEKGSTIKQEHLKKANIGAVVVCRMKSTRLPKKALIKMGNITSIELCIKNSLQFENVNKVVLATSTHADDAVLKDYTYSSAVDFFQGSEDDVIDRFIKIADKYAFDIIIRVTGDSPFRSNEVLQILLDSHFETGSDYTAAKNAALGTNTEIINVNALKRVVELFKGAPYSEYMSYYFKNNPDYFKLNIVTLPEKFVNNFRLTLDYEEDLTLFKEIEKQFNYSENNFDTFKLFEFLNENPQIADINKNCEIAYTPDSELMKKIIDYTTLKKQ